jgi:hypothetical protein
MTIQQYVMDHTERGECKCGRCIDVGGKPDPQGHTADMIFFKVSQDGDTKAEDFIRLSKENKGDYAQVDPFDGKEHGYIELGAWLGDQGVALQYMALGTLLGLFDLLTPRIVMPFLADENMIMQLAGGGLVTIVKKKEAQAKAS